MSGAGEWDRLRVELGPRSYDILIGEGLIAAAGRHLAPVLGGRRVVVVTDDNVAGLCLDALERGLDVAGIEHQRIVLPPGEASKDFAHLERLIDRLLEIGVERQTTLVALGGGVIGDLAGFAAAVTLRGIDVVQVPTTLLAQVDSAVGGKTGINTRHGKNLVGAFHQPRLVLADIGALATLPARELRAGYGEVVKYGLIEDAPFFAWLEANGAALIAGDAAARRHAVVESCRAKARIVAADEREAGRRALLNLGHTFAHAFEAAAGYGGGLLHGEAVAAGLVLAFELSHLLGHCPAEAVARVRSHLAAVGLPTGPGTLGPGRWRADQLMAHMGRDKKVRDGRIAFVLARDVGRAFIADDVSPAQVRDLIDRALAA